jgi:hypothetical protein
MSRTVGIASLMVAALAGPAPARATCALPPAELVWSYPADGQSDVPTNATIWILLPNWTQPGSVSLDGVEIPVNGFGFGYVPEQPLAPSSPHQVTFRATSARVQPPVDLTIRFTTGPGPAEAKQPSAPAVLWASASATRDLTPACQRVLDAMECFDTGPRFHLIFTTEAMPLLWIIEAVGNDPTAAPSFELWPGSCGLPEVFVEDADTRACNRHYRLHALTEAGLRAMTAPLCPGDLVKMPLPPSPVAPDAGADQPPDQPQPDGGAPSSTSDPGPKGSDPAVRETESRSGCAIAGRRKAAGVAWLALLLVPLARRRSRRLEPAVTTCDRARRPNRS